MNLRAALLAVASATGLILSRAMDGLGVLPGVHESAAVQSAAVAPSWTAAGALACAALGLAVAGIVRRAPAVAVISLVAGQSATAFVLEEAARSVAHAPEGGDDSAIWLAVAAQLLVACLAVSTALLVLRIDVPVVASVLPVPRSRPPRHLPVRQLALRRVGVPQGRAPPSGW